MLHIYKCTRCWSELWYMYRLESVNAWQCGGLPILLWKCKVVPYAGVSLGAARNSSKLCYVPLLGNASSSHSTFSARLPGWIIVVRSSMESMFRSFSLPFFNTSLQFWRQYVRILLIQIYPSVYILSIHCSEFTNYWLIIAIVFYRVVKKIKISQLLSLCNIALLPLDYFEELAFCWRQKLCVEAGNSSSHET